MKQLRDAADNRFIPASAGNSPAGASSSPPRTVHPRERGEQPGWGVQLAAAHGSSPRARGTARLGRPARRRARFIPASAGNSPAGASSSPPRTVHPRERGEQPGWGVQLAAAHGSSPRARGTGHGLGDVLGASRFIPASAGNRLPSWLPPSVLGVHPRERGEQSRVGQVGRSPTGSSPRARGTEDSLMARNTQGRFIPASAGNRASPNRSKMPPTVHPRERGEQYLLVVAAGAFAGSSPRARGTVPTLTVTVRMVRFIPASAGNRRVHKARTRSTSVHPRERGEQWTRCNVGSRRGGSSPRARGTGSHETVYSHNGRFIPASAGNRLSGIY